MAPPRCPVCSAPHATCGGPTRLIHPPVDFTSEPRRAGVAELHEYEIPHRDHTTTVQLSEEDAKLYPGAKRKGKVAAGEPQPVTRPPYATDDSETDPAERENLVTAKKADPPLDKSRTTRRG